MLVAKPTTPLISPTYLLRPLQIVCDANAAILANSLLWYQRMVRMELFYLLTLVRYKTAQLSACMRSRVQHLQ